MPFLDLSSKIAAFFYHCTQVHLVNNQPTEKGYNNTQHLCIISVHGEKEKLRFVVDLCVNIIPRLRKKERKTRAGVDCPKIDSIIPWNKRTDFCCNDCELQASFFERLTKEPGQISTNSNM